MRAASLEHRAAPAAPREVLNVSAAREAESAAVGPEQRRNALLRRADWRFLLPRPHVDRAACFAHGALADAVGACAHRVWQAGANGVEIPAGGAHELAVAANPDRRVLRAAAQALEAGGVCYTEWRGSRWQSPARVRARLEAAGFARVACYAAYPDPDAGLPVVWSSLDASGTALDFLARLPQPWSRRGRLRRRLRRALWRAAPALRTTAFICAVARKPGVGRTTAGDAGARDHGEPRRGDGWHDALRETVRAEWSAWGLGHAPARLGWTLLTGGRRSINKVVALAFADRDPMPCVALKLARVTESHAPLRNEARALEAMQRAHPAGVGGAPRLLLCRADASAVAVAETALRGRPLSTLYRERPPVELATRATDWLLRLVSEPGVRPLLGDRCRRIVTPVVRDFEASFGAVVDRAMQRDAVAALATLDVLDAALPVVHEQRDFAPWNLLVDDGGALVVLDWESSEPRGLPLLDLVYFLTHLAFDLAHAADLRSRRDAHRAVLDPATPVGAVARRCMDRYRERVALPSDAVWPLRLLTWMLHARSEYRQLCAEASPASGGRPDAETLRRSLFLTLWEEEMRRGPAS